MLTVLQKMSPYSKLKIGAVLLLLLTTPFIIYGVQDILVKKQRLEPLPIDRIRSVVISSPTCTAPCWQGITPGLSTENELEDLLNQKPSNRFEDIREVSGGQYIWYDSYTEMLMDAKVEDGIVSRLGFVANIDLGTLLNQLDSPETFKAYVATGPSLLLNLHFFYRDKGLIAETLMDEAPTGTQPWVTCDLELTPAIPIHFIYLVDPSSTFERMVELETNGEIQDWTGLGTIDLIPCS